MATISELREQFNRLPSIIQKRQAYEDLKKRPAYYSNSAFRNFVDECGEIVGSDYTPSRRPAPTSSGIVGRWENSEYNEYWNFDSNSFETNNISAPGGPPRGRYVFDGSQLHLSFSSGSMRELTIPANISGNILTTALPTGLVSTFTKVR